MENKDIDNYCAKKILMLLSIDYKAEMHEIDLEFKTKINAEKALFNSIMLLSRFINEIEKRNVLEMHNIEIKNKTSDYALFFKSFNDNIEKYKLLKSYEGDLPF